MALRCQGVVPGIPAVAVVDGGRTVRVKTVIAVESVQHTGVTRAAEALIPAFEGEPAGRVVLTGGTARWARFVERASACLRGMPCGLAVYRSENGMMELAKGAFRVLNCRFERREYWEVEEALFALE